MRISSPRANVSEWGKGPCEKGANTRLIFAVNDQSAVAVFPETTTEYVQDLKNKALYQRRVLPLF
jgi:hypothetical protein